MYRLIPVLLLAVLLAGCSCRGHYDVETRTDNPAPPTKEKPADDRNDDRDNGDKSDEERPKDHGRAAFHIPPGHLPDPGECRIWIPGVPPGQQAPAGNCAVLAEQVPPGAWLITRASKKSKEFEVTVYDEVELGMVLEIRIYSTKDGSFIGTRP